MDDLVAQFTDITAASPERASQYLRLTENNLEQAIQLYFASDGVDMGASLPSEQPSHGSSGTAAAPVQIESDDEDQTSSRTQQGPSVEDDEAMARRLQDEMYGGAGGAGSGGGGGAASDDTDEFGVRRPQARQAQTLLGPGSDWRDDYNSMNAAIAEQLMNRQQRRAMGRAGIFNQQAPNRSIWNAGDDRDPQVHQQNLSRATGGASEASSKSNMLAEMYRPPFEIMAKHVSWEGVRADGKEQEKWILVNVQDPNIFDCQILNRDVWKDQHIQETIKENFVFVQYNKGDPQASQYLRFYFQSYENEDAYPHIAIIDPRTGEQVKVWSGRPAPKAIEFLQQLHEFLDRYSLDAAIANPVATRRQEKKKKEVHEMTEEEMLQMAMQNSIAAGESGASRAHDPDVLTRAGNDANMRMSGGGAAATATATAAAASNGIATPPLDEAEPPPPPTSSPFDHISSANPHTEPAASAPGTTRIQFRHPGGRVVRRFELADSVRRIYEWLKAEPLDGKVGVPFELIFMGRNLIDLLDDSIEAAGLKNGSVMVEFVEG